MKTTSKTALVTLLALVLVTSACSSKAVIEGKTGRAGIEGIVTIGPSCPVQRMSSPCPDRPYRARVEIRDARGKVLQSFYSAEDGTFRVDLAPGTYTLVPQNGKPLPAAQPLDVTVREGSYSRVEITYDSGIR